MLWGGQATQLQLGHLRTGGEVKRTLTMWLKPRSGVIDNRCTLEPSARDVTCDVTHHKCKKRATGVKNVG